MAARRHWRFTLFIETVAMEIPFRGNEIITHLAAQVEACPTTGKLHWQGMLSLARKQKRNWLVNNLASCWWGPTDFPSSARQYVWKDDTCVDPLLRIEDGEMVVEEKLLDSVAKMVVKGVTNQQIALVCPKAIMMWGRGIETLRDAINVKPPRGKYRPWVCVRWGPTQCGKSEHSYDEWKAAPGGSYKWIGGEKFHGYNGEENILIEEFDKKKVPLGQLLELLDVYPIDVLVNYKGQVPFYGKRFWITSTMHPSGWYRECDWSQVERRLTHVDECGDDIQVPSRSDRDHVGAVGAPLISARSVPQAPSSSQSSLRADDDNVGNSDKIISEFINSLLS